jgi:hypothetical protein
MQRTESWPRYWKLLMLWFHFRTEVTDVRT